MQWGPPADMALWAGALDVSICCWLAIYNCVDYVSEVYVKVAALLGGMFVPSSVRDFARQKGDSLGVALHIRTNDRGNRFFTNAVPLNQLKAQKSGAVVVPLL
jgi:hypothetical protein